MVVILDNPHSIPHFLLFSTPIPLPIFPALINLQPNSAIGHFSHPSIFLLFFQLLHNHLDILHQFIPGHLLGNFQHERHVFYQVIVGVWGVGSLSELEFYGFVAEVFQAVVVVGRIREMQQLVAD